MSPQVTQVNLHLSNLFHFCTKRIIASSNSVTEVKNAGYSFAFRTKTPCKKKHSILWSGTLSLQ
jgi:hypothetical protein